MCGTDSPLLAVKGNHRRCQARQISHANAPPNELGAIDRRRAIQIGDCPRRVDSNLKGQPSLEGRTGKALVEVAAAADPHRPLVSRLKWRQELACSTPMVATLWAARDRYRGNASAKPLTWGGGTVGWLTVDPIKQVSAVRDVSFLRQQSSAFTTIAIALLLGAALLAILLARHLSRPLGAVTSVVKRLAEGDYGSRVAARGKDEITELSQNIDTLARTLDDNQHARQRWIADISHELRTPLAIMRGELESLQDGVRPVDSLSIDSLHAEIIRLGKLVNDLHELSLSDIGALTYQMQPIDLGEVLDEAVELFHQRLASRDLALEYSRDAGEQWPINGDRQRLLQLFTNLLENSLRYTDAGGRIIIRLKRYGRRAVIEIADTTPTVSMEECDKLFDRLYRVDPSRTRAQGGSGLGLSICKNIADAHNAVIKAAPSELGGIITLKEY